MRVGDVLLTVCAYAAGYDPEQTDAEIERRQLADQLEQACIDAGDPPSVADASRKKL